MARDLVFAVFGITFLWVGAFTQQQIGWSGLVNVSVGMIAAAAVGWMLRA